MSKLLFLSSLFEGHYILVIYSKLIELLSVMLLLFAAKFLFVYWIISTKNWVEI